MLLGQLQPGNDGLLLKRLLRLCLVWGQKAFPIASYTENSNPLKFAQLKFIAVPSAIGYPFCGKRMQGKGHWFTAKGLKTYHFRIFFPHQLRFRPLASYR